VCSSDLLAGEFVRASPRSGMRELATHLAAAVPEARWERGAIAELDEPAGEPATELEQTGELQATLHLMREEVLASVRASARA
jgi:hypothetical protein